ncbi:hypothetical protein [Elizabethkingia anophelis]|uniref:hypothetical protein n=1 Tax=Elizabethkingia anophelis TaxID=1117645 RepID=UPI0015942C8B|nr:hypothetical protein [Elizabethkingia anophelis]
MNLSKLNVQELIATEQRSVEGGFPPVVLAAWAAMVAIDCALVTIYSNQQKKK